MADLTDAALQRRFRRTCAGLEALGADEDTARLAARIVLHLRGAPPGQGRAGRGAGVDTACSR